MIYLDVSPFYTMSIKDIHDIVENNKEEKKKENNR